MFDTELPLYGLFILLSLLANIIVVMLLYRNFKFSRDEIIGALVYENLGIIGGAKILTYLQDSHQHDLNTLWLTIQKKDQGYVVYLYALTPANVCHWENCLLLCWLLLWY